MYNLQIVPGRHATRLTLSTIHLIKDQCSVQSETTCARSDQLSRSLNTNPTRSGSNQKACTRQINFASKLFSLATSRINCQAPNHREPDRPGRTVQPAIVTQSL